MAQTIVVRGFPDAGSSCLQPLYHTLSKIVNSHIAMNEICLWNGTANGNSGNVDPYFLSGAHSVTLYTSSAIFFKLNTRWTTDRNFNIRYTLKVQLKYDSYVRVLLEQKARQAPIKLE